MAEAPFVRTYAVAGCEVGDLVAEMLSIAEGKGFEVRCSVAGVELIARPGMTHDQVVEPWTKLVGRKGDQWPGRPIGVAILCLVGSLICAAAAAGEEVLNVDRAKLGDYLAKPRSDKVRYEEELRLSPGWRRSAQAGRLDPKAAEEASYRFVGQARVYTFRSAAAKRALVAEFDARMVELRGLVAAPPALPPLLYVHQLQVGQLGVPFRVGFFGEEELRLRPLIDQVIDGSNMLVRYENPKEGGEDFVLWIKAPTAGLVDGRRVLLDRCLEVTGTKTYTTAAGGSKTVFVLQPFDFEKALAAAKEPKR